eukprot:TRINITY_DN8689_c0_g1_i5.p1 TRINITY_DN8689_c0_g1~~TRINITY_DN8689_c0_g1_i5.p1  ORF type:complete len:202 (-),score=25.09 TRINITY_DN8689_c0_g1_i5:32-547(-)
MCIRDRLWVAHILNMRNNETSCMNHNDNLFLVISFYLFYGTLWILTLAVSMFVILLIVVLILDRLNPTLLETTNEENGLSEQELKKIETKSFKGQETEPNSSESRKDETSKTCLICFEDFICKDSVMEMPNCGHIFHDACVKQWLSLQASCPYCRNDIRKALPKITSEQSL